MCSLLARARAVVLEGGSTPATNSAQAPAGKPVQPARSEEATPCPTPCLIPPGTPPPAMPEAWFELGASALSRERFAHDRDTKTHPGWWDYLYELHNRGLAVVDSKVMEGE